MRLTFIVTIDPVKDIRLLNLLLHSLNLQTSQAFNVVFHNQTLLAESDVWDRLTVKPEFEYEFYTLDKNSFLGLYPLWDLYDFHNTAIAQGLVGDYLMSLHMEEFPDVDYVESAVRVLSEQGLDILLGNLCRTDVGYRELEDLLTMSTHEDFHSVLEVKGLTRSPHWGFPRLGVYALRPAVLKETLLKWRLFGRSTRLQPTVTAVTKVDRYLGEDLYFMKTEFAVKYNWFLRGHAMYFEDIHICEIEGVCELARELSRLTEFPVYLNASRVYHVRHGRFYYQLLDEEFTCKLLELETSDPIVSSLQKAVLMYKEGQWTLEKALTYSRRNAEKTGTQDLNYRYHMRYLKGEGGDAAI